MAGMQPRDVYELVNASDPRISTDGSRIAYVVTRLDEESNEYRSAIWVTPYDGGDPVQFTSGERRDTSPRWSPDGKSLAFASNRGEDAKAPSSLYVISAAGGEARKLTDLKEGVEAVVWSPDSTRIAFTARVRDDAYEEEDDKRRAPRRFRRVFHKLDSVGWTGDRRKHVFVVDADGGEAKALTGDEASYTAPSFSPDGRLIAFQMTPEDGTYPHHAQIGVMKPDGSEQKILTASLDRQCAPYPDTREPIWDGDRIVFAIEDRGNIHLYAVPADGSAEPELLV